MTALDQILSPAGRLTLAGVPEGHDALVLADAARAAATRLGAVPILHIAREDARLATLADALAFFAPDVAVLALPAWDCLPYDRVSPHGDVCAARMHALSRLASDDQAGPRIVLTTVNAALQRLPERAVVKAASLTATLGDEVDPDALTAFLVTSGYTRASQVTEPGEFAVRGGLVDIFPPGTDQPLRLDFFGDTLDAIRRFDPLTQRTSSKTDRVELKPVGEFALDEAAIKRFRRGYVAEFGTVTDNDPLYEAVSGGRKHQGAEHWLPLFHDRLESVFDYVPGAVVFLDHQAEDARQARLAAIDDYYQARREALDAPRTALSTPYKPLPPDRLYLTAEQWTTALDAHAARQMSPFTAPETDHVVAFDGKRGRDFAPERNQREVNVYDALRDHIASLRRAGNRVVVASYSSGARERLDGVLADHGIAPTAAVARWADVQALDRDVVALAVLPLEAGFVAGDLAVITEQDVLGDRLVRKARRSRRADNFLTEASSLTPGDLVVHVDHGVGRFEGLETITVSGAPHDCLALTYAGGDRLYVPVENIEVLSRYGSEDAGANLDKLGGGAWQARKAKLKQRIREMADELIKIAAARALREADRFTPTEGLYQEFSARFPFTETDDQTRAIADVLADLSSGRPMDRLICGDVGFGKTEVALRSAFVSVMTGAQVAVIAPTTLLARQHYKTFTERFRGLPVHIAQLSRLVGQREATKVKQALTDGQVDIVIGTHALLGKSIRFKNLGLLVVDEEQHFGVAHKERLKQLRADVHVLTLTATPIPRTLQLAMSGIRDLSLIATPPVDRLAVRTFVLPFDQVVVREALLREHYRGGQSFYVCPHIADLEEATTFLKDHVPEVKFAVAHGQMPARQIEDVMTAFYDGTFDVLVSTAIVESGLDIPTANTLVVHRADRFGLAQLYQLRGRVGRSKLRAYAYLTVPAGRVLTQTADKRLQVLQALDTLGAGFTIASHDMDIRGAGNLLGEEQSGHVREVGVELYQQMLEEAVAEARAGLDEAGATDGQWSPQINLGATVLIPEHYVPDLNLRMALYRRLASLETREEIEGFAAELIDRFGPLPDEVRQLMDIITIKSYCLAAGIERIEAGPKGATLAFRNDRFANPAGLVAFISKQQRVAKLRPDHTLVYLTRMDAVDDRLKTAMALARNLAKVAREGKEAA